MSPPSDSSSQGDASTALGERLSSAGALLALAAALFVLGSVFFGLPYPFALAAIVILALAASFLPPLGRPAHGGQATREAAAGSAGSSVEATIEALPQAAFLLDAGGIVRYANERAEQLFPATRRGDPFTLTFRWPNFADALDEATAGRRSTVEFSQPGESASVYAVILSPLQGGAKIRGFILATFDDVSDRLAVARMRADFVANASHELRTPLASLTGFIETLLGRARNDPAATEKFLRVMLDQARRMRRLIDDLLSLSRAEMRVHSRPTERTDLAAVLRHVGDALAPLATEHSVRLSLDVPVDPVDIIGDRDELVQVVQNLVENAIRYGASGGRVDARLEVPGGDRPVAKIEVRDYGPGIAPEHLPRLTERFYRVDSDASRALKGTGLGLAIVKHILTRHQGRLNVASEPGQGASFVVELPLAAGEFRLERNNPASPGT